MSNDKADNSILYVAEILNMPFIMSYGFEAC
jgi:hypothetical protein